MTNTIYLVRHGQTEWNIKGKTQGHGNSKLTEKGKSQAMELADSMIKYPIDYIYSSDLGRAVETAEIISDKFNLDVIETPALREMGFGKWEGLLIKEIQEDYKDIYHTWRNQPHLAQIPGGETLEIIKERTDKFLTELNEKHDGKHIVLVTHSVTARVILLSVLNSGMENIYRINQGNTALNIIEFRDYGPVVIKMNDTSHIKSNHKLENSALE